MLDFKVCVVLLGCAMASNASFTGGCCCCNPCGLESGEDMCSGHNGKTFCDPIIVRPQEIPKPVLPAGVTLTPIPGPCACKKAIVKPAILPKPVCNPTSTCTTIVNSACCNQCQNCNCQSLTTLVNGQTITLDGALNPAALAPADAVSIALAQQNAKQCCVLDEDRLAFGFRKIPIELPKQTFIRQNNIPEEKLFSLNGQIVELKPVKIGCAKKSLEEEAVEDLLALEEEESIGCDCDWNVKGLSLGELGYVPAAIPQKSFIDIPAAAVQAAIAGATTAGCTNTAIPAGYKAGNVVFKTVPKPASFSGPAVDLDTADCDSNEATETVVYEEPAPCSCGFACAPCGCTQSTYQTCSSSSTSSKVKKASLIIQKLCN